MLIIIFCVLLESIFSKQEIFSVTIHLTKYFINYRFHFLSLDLKQIHKLTNIKKFNYSILCPNISCVQLFSFLLLPYPRKPICIYFYLFSKTIDIGFNFVSTVSQIFIFVRRTLFYGFFIFSDTFS